MVSHCCREEMNSTVTLLTPFANLGVNVRGMQTRYRSGSALSENCPK